jgi:hypothetical protein
MLYEVAHALALGDSGVVDSLVCGFIAGNPFDPAIPGLSVWRGGCAIAAFLLRSRTLLESCRLHQSTCYSRRLGDLD